MLKEIDLAGAMTRLREGSDKVYMRAVLSKDEVKPSRGFTINGWAALTVTMKGENHHEKIG